MAQFISSKMHALKDALDRLGLEVRLKSSRLHPWETSQDFVAAIAPLRERLTMPPDRAYRLWEICHHVQALPGAVAECGSFRGATAKLIAGILPERDLHLFDTFAGHPGVDRSKDGAYWNVGDFNDTSAEDVAAFLADTRAQLYPGVVPSTLSAVAEERFCFVHLDMDLYAPTKDALDFFHPRMVPGGCILIDDYGIRSGAGIEPAVQEFAVGIDETPLYFFTGQALIVRHPRASGQGDAS
jgi:hypothetical protein